MNCLTKICFRDRDVVKFVSFFKTNWVLGVRARGRIGEPSNIVTFLNTAHLISHEMFIFHQNSLTHNETLFMCEAICYKE